MHIVADSTPRNLVIRPEDRLHRAARSHGAAAPRAGAFLDACSSNGCCFGVAWRHQELPRLSFGTKEEVTAFGVFLASWVWI